MQLRMKLLKQPIEPMLPAPVAAVLTPRVEISRPIEPAPVTEEEIAALLETALFMRHEPAEIVHAAVPEEDEHSTPAVLRRRELPRRSDAA